MRVLVALLAFLAASPATAGVVCTLVADAASGALLVEDGDCDRRMTPASTFKIALAVIGYDTGFLTGAQSPALAFREGDPDWGGAAWRRTTTPETWLEHSVVWYSQRITHALGAEDLTRRARALGYGNADFTGDPGSVTGWTAPGSPRRWKSRRASRRPSCAGW